MFRSVGGQRESGDKDKGEGEGEQEGVQERSNKGTEEQGERKCNSTS